MQGGSSVEGGKESEQLPKRKRGPDAVVGTAAPDTEPPQPKKKKKKGRRKRGGRTHCDRDMANRA